MLKPEGFYFIQLFKAVINPVQVETECRSAFIKALKVVEEFISSENFAI